MRIFETTIDEELRSFSRLEAAAADTSGMSCAAALALVHTGAELSDRTISTIADVLADLAIRYGLSPDETQEIIFRHEPVLENAI